MRVEPRAVIFDYGNVLTGPQGQAEIAAMAAILGVAVEQFVRECWRYRLEYDQGRLSPTAYWDTVSEGCSRALTAGQIECLIELDNRSWAHPNCVVAAWATTVRAAGLLTAILSNMPAPMRDYLPKCTWLPEVDQRTLSCDVGSAKPMPEIYAHCLEGLGVEPGEALFLDDREENVQAARELGIHTILFSSVEQAHCELQDRFRVPAPLRR